MSQSVSPDTSSISIRDRYGFIIWYGIKVLCSYIVLESCVNAYISLVDPAGNLYSPMLAGMDVTALVKYSILMGAYYILTLFNFSAFVTSQSVGLLETGGVGISNTCMGFMVWVAILVLIAFFPGKLKTKLWFIPLAIFFLHFVNIMRICILAILTQYPVSLEDHHAIYNNVIYAMVMGIFFIYVQYFSIYRGNKYSGEII